MDSQAKETTVQVKTAPEPEMPKNDVLFVEVPAGGFSLTSIQKYIRGGYSLWGVVPIAVPGKVDGELPTEAYYIVLKLDVNSIPVNLLAHHIVKARADKGGLNQVAQTLFGLSLQQLEDGLKEARERSNGR